MHAVTAEKRGGICCNLPHTCTMPGMTDKSANLRLARPCTMAHTSMAPANARGTTCSAPDPYPTHASFVIPGVLAFVSQYKKDNNLVLSRKTLFSEAKTEAAITPRCRSISAADAFAAPFGNMIGMGRSHFCV